MTILRTPDDRFDGLPGYAFAPHFVEVEAEGAPPLRMHYVDEGEGPTVLLLHGEPTWSYLYRTMIPVLVGRGLRCVAPDLVGFGKSDKPAAVSDYTYARHVGWVASFMERLDLRDVTAVVQDWGSLIGLRLVGERPERFARVVVANGFLPEGKGKLPLVFRVWQAFARWSPVFPVGRIVEVGCASKPLDPDVRAAYDAPFPSSKYKAGSRAFPVLVPTSPDDPGAAENRRAWEGLEQFERPVLTAFATGDPIFREMDRVLQRRIPGAAGQPHTRVRRAGHFIQEDQGPELARIIGSWVTGDEF